MMTLGERIKWARLKAVVTKSALAAAADVSPSAVTQWENGDTKTLKSASVLAVAKALNVDYEWLATGKGEPVGQRVEQPSAAYDVSAEALEVARGFDQLTPDCKEHVRRQIELLRGTHGDSSGRRRAVQHDVEIKQGTIGRRRHRSKSSKMVR